MALQITMISSIPTYIAAPVAPPWFNNNSASLMATVRRHIGSPLKCDHRALEWEADSIRLMMCEDFVNYYEKIGLATEDVTC